MDVAVIVEWIVTFSHPDYYRRLWSLTRSARPLILKQGARGLIYGLGNITAGGDLHPALKLHNESSIAGIACQFLPWAKISLPMLCHSMLL